MANVTDASHKDISKLDKFEKHYIPVLDMVSLLLCFLVFFALYKSRDKWRSSTSSYVAITFILIITNVLKAVQLLLYRIIEKDGDSLLCALQGFFLVGTEVFSQFCIVVLVFESTIIVTYALNRARFVKKTSYVPRLMRRFITNSSSRFNCFLVSLITLTGAECAVLQKFYGFGSSQKHPEICNIKFENVHEWDPKVMFLNWVTFCAPVASIALVCFLIVYVHCQNYRNKHAPTMAFWKLAFVPSMYSALNTPFILRELFSMEISLSVLKIAGHSMPGMLALCIWYQNSYARNYIYGHVCGCCCAPGKAKKRKGNYGPRSLQMENSFRESLISSSFDEDGYEALGRLDTSTESLLSNVIENTESLETDVEDDEVSL